MKSWSVFALSILCFLLIVGHLWVLSADEMPMVKEGVLDLSNWNFQTSGAISLNGYWNFYWGQLLTPGAISAGDYPKSMIHVPKPWNNQGQKGEGFPAYGHATYQLTILLPKDNEILGLLIPRISHACKIWVNDKLILTMGKTGQDVDSMIAKTKSEFVIFDRPTQRIDIVIQVSNYVHRVGGLAKELRIGIYQQLLTQWTLSVSMQAVVSSTLLILSFYHIVLTFWLKRKDPLSVIIVAMYCGAMLRVVSTGDTILLMLFPDFPWEILLKLEYMTIPLLTYLFALYISGVYSSGRYLLPVRVFGYIATLLILFVWLTPVSVFSQWLIAQQAFMMVGVIWITYIIFRAALDRKPLSRIFLLGNAITIFTFINDILYFQGIVHTFLMGHYGFYMVLLLQSTVLSRKFAKAFQKSQYLSNHLESLVKIRTNELNGANLQLEGEIAERKKAEEDLKAAQADLIEEAHRAGMADIATSVLHNIGNILNSAKTSSQVILLKMNQTAHDDFRKANDIFRDQSTSLKQFLQNDDRAEKLLSFYLLLEQRFDSELKEFHENMRRVHSKIKEVEKVIAAQLSYAWFASKTEHCSLEEVVQDTLLILSEIEKFVTIQLEKKGENIPNVPIQKTKLVHILINLLNNSKDAMDTLAVNERKLDILLEHDETAVYLRVKDNGKGIPAENLKKVFNLGFTSKENGYGFGLHSSANFMTEMHGEMWAESDGPGLGATFVLKFLTKPEDERLDPIHSS